MFWLLCFEVLCTQLMLHTFIYQINCYQFVRHWNLPSAARLKYKEKPSLKISDLIRHSKSDRTMKSAIWALCTVQKQTDISQTTQTHLTMIFNNEKCTSYDFHTMFLFFYFFWWAIEKVSTLQNQQHCVGRWSRSTTNTHTHARKKPRIIEAQFNTHIVASGDAMHDAMYHCLHKNFKYFCAFSASRRYLSHFTH